MAAFAHCSACTKIMCVALRSHVPADPRHCVTSLKGAQGSEEQLAGCLALAENLNAGTASPRPSSLAGGSLFGAFALTRSPGPQGGGLCKQGSVNGQPAAARARHRMMPRGLSALRRSVAAPGC